MATPKAVKKTAAKKTAAKKPAKKTAKKAAAKKAAKKTPIDPLGGGPLVLEGRIVTMVEGAPVIAHGRCYINESTFVAVQDAAAPAPPGFASAPVLATEGTIYPGLIELHNHLPYNALRLWDVPKLYANRDTWAGTAAYRSLISGPMQVLGKSPDVVPALIRYVEAKTLLGGTTTSQGVALFSNSGIQRFYRGIVRNVEETDEAELPEANTRVADVDAATAEKFLARLKKETCFILHLSEGTNEAARKHFLALRIAGDAWAITPQLAGIHCVAMKPEDFAVYGQRGGAMVWSPFSNLLLYGATADVKAARAAGVRIGIGSDWSPSGSKNLLGELKVAAAWNEVHQVFTGEEILAMATRTAAAILQWDSLLGTLAAGKRADVLVVDGVEKDPYEQLFRAREADVGLVLINGVPRYGHATWMAQLGAKKETLKVGTQAQALNFVQETQDPLVGKISLADATDLLADALKNIVKRAKDLEKPKPVAALSALGGAPVWQLELDEIQPTEMSMRPLLPSPDGGRRVGARALAGKGSEPISKIVKSMVLDPLTVAGDGEFLDAVKAEKNLTQDLVDGLVNRY